MQKISAILNNIVFSWIVRGLAYLVPRDKSIWVFNGWFKGENRQTFADNSKYVFLKVSNEHKSIKAIWIGDDKHICKLLRQSGYIAHSVNSFSGIYYSLRAGCTIIDANFKINNWRLSSGSKVVQLWHADGIKKLSYTSKISFANFLKFIFKPNLFQRFSFLISSSKYISDKFTGPSFDVDSSRLKITGLPRYDAFFSTVPGQEIDIHKKLQETLESIKAKNPNKILLYAPTFRRGKSLQEQLSPIDFGCFNDYLVNQNYFLVISLHPKFAASKWVPDIKYSNIFFSNPGYDVYPLLKNFDLVITDYSSICIDFLMLNKPTIFYVYDFDEYKKNEGLADEFWNYMPGPRVKTFEDLVSALSMSSNQLLEGSTKVRSEIFTYTDAKNSERVVSEILKLNNVK